MLGSKVYKEEWDVDSKLAEFGVTIADLNEIALKAVTARNDASSNDPINAPGLLSYIYGTRAVREVFSLDKGWEVDRTDNIESAFNQAANVKIVFQNVDIACAPSSPKAISGKGAASKKMVENATCFLFPEMEAEYEESINSSVWYFCVSVDGDEICAELSRPRSIEGNQFEDFHERIFIIKGGDWGALNVANDDDLIDDQDFDITITRK